VRGTLEPGAADHGRGISRDHEKAVEPRIRLRRAAQRVEPIMRHVGRRIVPVQAFGQGQSHQSLEVLRAVDQGEQLLGEAGPQREVRRLERPAQSTRTLRGRWIIVVLVHVSWGKVVAFGRPRQGGNYGTAEGGPATDQWALRNRHSGPRRTASPVKKPRSSTRAPGASALDP